MSSSHVITRKGLTLSCPPRPSPSCYVASALRPISRRSMCHLSSGHLGRGKMPGCEPTRALDGAGGASWTKMPYRTQAFAWTHRAKTLEWHRGRLEVVPSRPRHSRPTVSRASAASINSSARAMGFCPSMVAGAPQSRRLRCIPTNGYRSIWVLFTTSPHSIRRACLVSGQHGQHVTQCLRVTMVCFGDLI